MSDASFWDKAATSYAASPIKDMQAYEATLTRARHYLTANDHLLEVGCGSGAYTLHVARAVGERGQVHALDIQAAMLRQLEAKLARPENQDIRNVRLVERSAYDLPFEDGTLDLVFGEVDR